MKLLRPYSIGRIGIRIQIRFNESVHSVREPESGFANPVLMWIHQQKQKCLKQKCLAVKMAPAIVLIDEYGILVLLNLARLKYFQVCFKCAQFLTLFSVFCESQIVCWCRKQITLTSLATTPTISKPFDLPVNPNSDSL